MKFKEPKLEQELKKSSILLRLAAQEFEKLSLIYMIEPVVTRVWDKVEGATGIHQDKRAIDFRNQYGDVRLYTDMQVKHILELMNEAWKRNDGFPTLIHHSFNHGPYHFHLQIAESVKAYEIV